MRIDLTHPFTDGMPTYPGDPAPSLKQIASVKKDGHIDYFLKTGMHAGTHIDAPAHMIEGGKRIDELPLQSFCGKGVVVDVRGKERIDVEIVEYTDIRRKDIVLFCSGLSKKYRETSYFTDYPVMTDILARELVKRKIKMVGFDTPSPDRAPHTVHKILLGAGILIIENLMNLESLLSHTQFDVHAFPLCIVADAAPARVVAHL